MGLNSSFRDFIPIETIKLEDLKGKTIAVDAYNAIYQFLTAIRDNNGDILKHDDVVISHLYGFINRYAYLIKNYNMHFIFVFDGFPSQLKNKTLTERKRIKIESEELRKKAVKDGDLEKAKLYSQRTVYLTSAIIKSFKKLLLMFGCDYVDAPEEAEANVVHLVNIGKADYASTQDYDAILYSCDHILRNLGLSYKGHYLPLQIISSSKILKLTGLTRDKLIYLATLTGTDFNTGIFGIGAKKGIKYIKNNNTIEETVEELVDDEKIMEDDKEKILSEIKAAYSEIKNMPVSENIIYGKYDKVEIENYLTSLGFNVEKIKDKL
jgi:flap endonuclease-1